VRSPAPDLAQDLVCVAVVATAHGVRGALKLRCFTERPASVAAYGPVCDRRGRELLTLRVIGTTKDGVIAEASGVTSREAAERLRGTELYVPRSRLPEPDEGEFYHTDLIGLEAVDRAGRACGRVVGVANYGAGDVIEIAPDEGETLLVPFTAAAVPEVDLAHRRVVIEPPAERIWEGDAA
jgi:16S rRNA processing protein RimM